MDQLLRFALNTLRHFIQDIGCLMDPATLLSQIGPYSSCRAIQKPSGRAADDAPQQSRDVMDFVAQFSSRSPRADSGTSSASRCFSTVSWPGCVTVEEAVLLR
jgi:hypothetical protein